VSAGTEPTPPATSLVPAGLALVVLLPTLILFPPETRGGALAGSALLLLLAAVPRWRASSDGPLHVLLVVALLVAALLARAAYVPAAAVEPMSVAFLALAGGVAASHADERVSRLALVALAAAAIGVALHAVYQRVWGLELMAEFVAESPGIPDRQALLTRFSRGRASAAFATPAALGGCLALTLPTTLGLAVGTRGKSRLLWIAALVLGGAAFVCAASMTAAAALLLATLLALVLWRGARRALWPLLLALFVLAGIVAVVRGSGVLDPDEHRGPWRLRAGNFRAAAEMALDHPWIGVGPGNFAELYPVYRRSDDNETRHAHNLPLELVAEGGWPVGIALTVAFFVVFLGPLAGERGGPAWKRGAAVGLAAFALHNLADFTAFMPSLLWVAALVRGLLGRRGAHAGAPAPLASTASLAALLLAAGAAALSGLATDARLAARAAAFAGDSQHARVLCERAVRLAPWDVDARVLSAGLAAEGVLAGGPVGEAERRHAGEEIEHAVRLAPVRAALRELRARYRWRSGDAPGAFADLSRAAELHPARLAYRTSRDSLRRSLTGVAPGGGP
jgi:hypothetical protein